MISKIEIKNFRLFDSLSLNVSAPLVIFSGKNATGKTSILEAIYLCSTSKSHRTNDLNTLIKEDKEYLIAEVQAEKKYKFILSKTGKSTYINKSEVKKISDFIGNLSVVLYSPDDISLVKGSRSEKRKFLDMEISLLDKMYLNILNSYKKVLSERNEVLKLNHPDRKLLDVLTNSLASYTNEIYLKRISFINKMNSLLNEISHDLNIEKIQFIYKSSYNPINIYDSFKKHEKSDFIMKSTGIGAHRDELLIEINDKDAKEYASEGQSRIISIAIKLALQKYIVALTGKEPVLLLDDVFAALDKSRITSLVKYVNSSKQTFITATSILEIPDEILKNALIIRI